MGSPTFNPAIGGSNQGGGRKHAPTQQTCVRDILGDGRMKKRHLSVQVEDKVTMRLKLEAKETASKRGKTDATVEAVPDGPVPGLAEQRKALEWLQANNPDADSGESDGSSSGSEEEDDDAELLRELEKIKRERAAEQERKQRALAEEQEVQKTQSALTSNPLLAPASQTVTKKWFEDTVFRNQALKAKTEKKRFINSTIHSDFHRSFLDRFVK